MKKMAPTPRAWVVLVAMAVSACSSASSVPPHPDAGSSTGSVTQPAMGTPSGSTQPSSTSPSGPAGAARRTDTFSTSKGDLHVTPIHHASVLFEFDGKAIYVDPTKEGNVEGLPKADVILVTDIHFDHMDQAGIDRVKQASTLIVGPPAVGEKLKLAVTLKNGDSREVQGVGVEAIAMYNLERGPSPGQRYHDKGRGNGYVLTFGDKRIYLSGDTECTDEMKALENIDVAFVCMNLPYTMPTNEAATCVKAFKPRVVFPYHYRGANLDDFMKQVDGVSEVRARNWY